MSDESALAESLSSEAVNAAAKKMRYSEAQKKRFLWDKPWNKGKKGAQISWLKGNKGKKEWMNLSGLKRSIPWNKGLKLSPMTLESRKKMSESHKNNPKVIEHLSKLRLKAIGRKNPKTSEKLKGNKNGIGYKHTKEQRIAKSLRQKGEKNHLWKGGITPINHKIRNSLEYRLWRESVFKRDDFTCVWCGKRGGELNADHIKPFAYFPELRFAIDNGRTLCIDCHKKTPTFGEGAKKLYG